MVYELFKSYWPFYFWVDLLFYFLLFAFGLRISDINLDLNRMTVAGQIKESVLKTLQDARTCELNFSGFTISKKPFEVKSVIDIRKKTLVRVGTKIGISDVLLKSMRLQPIEDLESLKGEKLNLQLEMVFTDSVTQRITPLKFLVIAQGDVKNKEQFKISTCVVKEVYL